MTQANLIAHPAHLLNTSLVAAGAADWDDLPFCPGCGAEYDHGEECTCPAEDECACVHLAETGSYPGASFDYVAADDCPNCHGTGTLIG